MSSEEFKFSNPANDSQTQKSAPMRISQKRNDNEFVCRGVSNEFATCYLNAAIQCILAMEPTRRAFMGLPDPSLPDYIIPVDSMTALIHLFFLQRWRPNITPQQTEDLERSKIVSIVGLLHRRSPGWIDTLRYGGSPEAALYHILQMVIEEGYVKGLEEGLFGQYRTKISCQTCGARYRRLDNEIMLSFGVPKAVLEFWKKARSLVLHDFFEFSERFSRLDVPLCSCRWVLYDLKCQTTIRRLPTTLIVDIARVYCRERMIYQEILDLSQSIEWESSANCYKYKLVAAVERVHNRMHSVAYVRSSKFLYENNSGNMWYRIDDREVKLVPLHQMLNKTDLTLLIYEQIEPLGTPYI